MAGWWVGIQEGDNFSGPGIFQYSKLCPNPRQDAINAGKA
jgi:hypothetical protein